MYIFNSFFTYNGMLSMKEINRRTEQENESAEQCIFLSSNGLCNTIWVLFLKKLPLGISSAPELFQRLITQILAGVEGTLGLKGLCAGFWMDTTRGWRRFLLEFR